MNPTELRATVGLAAIFAARLLGLFMVYPVFARLAQPLAGATPVTIGLALGIYGLAQGLLQIPLGLLSDRIGRRPVIVAGLAVFVVGSVVAALSTSIFGVTIGRLVQGAGAVGSSILAWTADLTREQVRTRAMAIVGVTIGLSFALALVVGPAIAAREGLSGIFWVTGALGLGGIGIALTLVPAAVQSVPLAPPSTVLHRFGRVIRDPQLLRLDAGIFALHAILTATFLVAPPKIAATFHTSPGNEWTVYLPILLASIALMIPAVGAAEALGRIKEVSIGAILVLIASLLALGGASTRTGCFIALSGFFAAFNVMEAVLPSLVTKTAPANAKGAATGLYSSSQFLGIFAGGAGGGAILAQWGPHGVWTFVGVLAIIWLLAAFTMRRPLQGLP
jgi:MFS family permease